MTKKLPRDVRSYDSDWDYFDDCEVEEVEERDDFDIFECEGFDYESLSSCSYFIFSFAPT